MFLYPTESARALVEFVGLFCLAICFAGALVYRFTMQHYLWFPDPAGVHDAVLNMKFDNLRRARKDLYPLQFLRMCAVWILGRCECYLPFADCRRELSRIVKSDSKRTPVTIRAESIDVLDPSDIKRRGVRCINRTILTLPALSPQICCDKDCKQPNECGYSNREWHD